MNEVEELLGVYDADGGVRGELAYVWGRWRGTAHCSLCDITHTAWRRKQEWDAMVAGLPVPLRVAHRNELAPDEARAVQGVQLAAVLARREDGWRVFLRADRLDALGGDVAAFEQAVRRELEA
ncbi:hypothetical protein GCM10009623_17830 [Nocardioides aestuarii]|uniref:Uncharacterized protein n=1 Tax=Nocardioides aestuarii TaxID=252231 RepID=A0ABW4TMS1_9ACTN